METGSLQISCLYTPLGNGSSSEQQDLTSNLEDLMDILFNISPSALQSDILLDDIILETSRSKTSGDILPAIQFRNGSANIKGVSGAAMAVVNANKLASKARHIHPVITGGVLTVTAISCAHLRNSIATIGGTLRPYLIVQAGSTVKQTKVKGDPDPVFDETFHFVLSDVTSAVVNIKVMDQFKFVKDQLIAELSIPINDIIAISGGISKEYKLQSRHAECSITLTCTWRNSV